MATQEQLTEALNARHALLTGKAKVSVGYGDRKVEYARAQLHLLDAYIAELRAQLDPGTVAPRRRNRVFYVTPQG